MRSASFLRARKRAVRDHDVGRRRANASVDASPVAHLPGADHEHLRTVEGRRGARPRPRPRPTGSRRDGATDARLGAHTLARLDRVPEHAATAAAARSLRAPRSATLRAPGRGSRSRRRSSSRGRRRPRTGARPRPRRNTCRGGRRTRRARRRSARRGSRARRRPRRGSACSARRSRCGCTSTAPRPRAGARARARSCSAFASCSSGTVMRSSSSTGTRAVVQTDDEERHVLNSSFASSTRPVRTSSTMPPSKARLPVGVLGLNAPCARNASRASASRSSRVSYSGPSSSFSRRAQVGGERRAAAAGADADDEVAAPDHRHQRKGAVGRVVCTVDPHPGGLAGRVHGRVHRRDRRWR